MMPPRGSVILPIKSSKPKPRGGARMIVRSVSGAVEHPVSPVTCQVIPFPKRARVDDHQLAEPTLKSVRTLNVALFGVTCVLAIEAVAIMMVALGTS
jgi:hypothetical protein